MKKTPEFVALGYVSNDHLVCVPKVVLDGKVEMSASEIQGGGPAADAAVGAARLGLSAAFVASVGDDADGRRILADFRDEGVDVSAIRVRPNARSPFAHCWITPDGSRSVAWTRNNLKLLNADEIPETMIKSARVLHLDGHHPDAAVAAAKLAKQNGVLINLDAGTFTPRIDELLKLADILIASEAFARQWSGETDLTRALAKLRTLGAAVTGVTAGSRGAWAVKNGGDVEFVPAFSGLNIVDTTGAGDAFHCGFAVRYLEDGDLSASMRFGAAVAGLKCAKLGARAGLPTRTQVENFLAQHRTAGRTADEK